VADIITTDDLPASLQTVELVATMLAGANAKASRVAPCLTWTGEPDSTTPAPSDGTLAEAKLILIGAIKRWAEAGSGALQAQNAGPFGVTLDTRQKSSGYRLWPSEITDLQDICKTPDDAPGRQAFSIDTVTCSTTHADICSLNFGALYCSCGADIAGFPLYEVTD
jgi:hypothetical protein